AVPGAHAQVVARPAPLPPVGFVPGPHGSRRASIPDAYFALDSTAIRPEEAKKLRPLLPEIKAHVGPICVFGHTDGLGSTQHNQELSGGRAWAIVDFLGLRGRPGLLVKGLGENGTINNEPCERCRRVDIILLPAVRRC